MTEDDAQNITMAIAEAINTILSNSPLAAYEVEQITLERNADDSKPEIALTLKAR